MLVSGEKTKEVLPAQQESSHHAVIIADRAIDASRGWHVV